MKIGPPQKGTARVAGFVVVAGVHAALLYGLWHYRILPPPAEAKTLFVSLLKETPRIEPPKPKPPPVKLVERIEPPPPQQIVAQAPVIQPDEPVAPPPPPAPQHVVEAPAELAPPPAPPRPAAPVLLGGELAVACPQRTPPSYPAFSRRLGEEGKVVLRVELDETGRVERATIKTSSGYARLDDAALNAVMEWRCHPAQRDGQPVRAVALQPFNFALEGR
jgi:protein TonB